MARVVVIKTVGDHPEMGDAIIDGITRNVIPIDTAELESIKAELANERAQRELRASGEAMRFETACRALEVKYATPWYRRVTDAIVGVWGLIWVVIFAARDYWAKRNS